MPVGMNPPDPADEPKLPLWNLNSSTMMVSTGMAIFHHMSPLLTFARYLMPRKFTAVKMTIKTTHMMKPVPVTFPVSCCRGPATSATRSS